ncbi:MAG: hypothetical protein LBG52_01940, partial [Candidatus Peribacteria bacterium]|nr:hypothetical protein [Candidatus Peribacteria bacterium]
MTGSFNDEDFFYRYFDIKDLDQRIGLVSSLLTADKSNVVNAINSLKHYVDSVVSSTEVANSPYASYADFLADAGATIQPGKYAYVTFLSTDNRPSGGNWNKITADETWRLDCSSVEWSPITNMTASMSANVLDEVGTSELKPAGNDLIVNWLQSFRNNLKSLFTSIKDKLDKKTTSGDYVYIHNGTTQNEKPYTIAPNAGTIAERTNTGTLRGATAVQDTDLVNLG